MGPPSAEAAKQKRMNLIMVALEEFALTGFHAASLRDIAEKAEVSTRTLYNHFPDKLTHFLSRIFGCKNTARATRPSA